MRLETTEGNTRLTLARKDYVVIGLQTHEQWLPMGVGVRDFGDRRGLVVAVDRRSLYRGSDGDFYVVQGLDADQATYGGLTLTRVAAPRCGVEA